MAKGLLFGFFSQQDADLNGYCVYRRHDGSLVNVTLVGINDQMWRDYEWPDICYVGRVDAWKQTIIH